MSIKRTRIKRRTRESLSRGSLWVGIFTILSYSAFSDYHNDIERTQLRRTLDTTNKICSFHDLDLEARSKFMRELKTYCESTTLDRVTRREVIAAFEELCRHNNLVWDDNYNLRVRKFTTTTPFPEIPRRSND